MKIGSQTVLLVAFAFMLLPGHTRVVASQDAEQIKLIRAAFVVMPAYQGCYPVEVNGIALGPPLEVILGQATVENRSDKTITAVRLGWKVHPFSKNLSRDFRCGIPSADRVFLSGSTPLISLGQLAPTETCHIGLNPLLGKAPATKTVFIDYPFSV